MMQHLLYNNPFLVQRGIAVYTLNLKAKHSTDTGARDVMFLALGFAVMSLQVKLNPASKHILMTSYPSIIFKIQIRFFILKHRKPI